MLNTPMTCQHYTDDDDWGYCPHLIDYTIGDCINNCHLNVAEASVQSERKEVYTYE
jgi:hypothetical protein